MKLQFLCNFIRFNLIELPYFLKQQRRIPCVDDHDFSVSSYWLIISRFPFLLLQKYSKAVTDLSAYVIFTNVRRGVVVSKVTDIEMYFEKLPSGDYTSLHFLLQCVRTYASI